MFVKGTLQIYAEGVFSNRTAPRAREADSLPYNGFLLPINPNLKYIFQIIHPTKKNSTHREVSAVMRNGCEAQNPISFFGFSRLHVFPQGKREHRGGADEQNGGIDDLTGLIGCAAHAEQDGDAPEDHDKAEGEDAPSQTGGGRHGTLKDSAKGQEKQSKVDEGEQPDHADAVGGGVRKARLETGDGQGYGVQEEVNDGMDGEGLFHGDLLFRVDRYVYAVLYHIYS